MSNESNEFFEGRQAYLEYDALLEDNPYPINTKEYDDWASGFLGAANQDYSDVGISYAEFWGVN